MAEQTVALREHVPLFHSSLSFSLISPRLISIIHHRCFKMINPFYLFNVRRINAACLIPQLAQWKCRRRKRIYITSVDVWRRPINIFSEERGRGDVLGSQILSAQVTQRLRGESRHGGRGFPSLVLCATTRPCPRDLSSLRTWRRRCLTSEGVTGMRGVPPELLSSSSASASINSKPINSFLCTPGEDTFLKQVA